jgi:type I restriction enzyme, S subunit
MHIMDGEMAMNREGWRRTTWGELASLEYGKSLREYQESAGEVPVYGTNGRIGFTDRPLCSFPSVVIGRKGAYRGVHYSDRPFFVIDTAFYLKPKTDELDLLFAYYQLLTQDINTMDSGSAIPSTSREDFYSLEIDLPPLQVQQRISSILSALDEKIELNRQTNATLEAIAQAIFKEWFVNFNFPGATSEISDSELGPIPKEWKVVRFGTVVDIKHGFAFKGEYFSEEKTDNILLTPGNFRIGGGFNYAKLKYYDGEYPSEYVLSERDLVVTMTDLSREGDTLGFPALIPVIDGKNILHNQRIGKIVINAKNLWTLYLYFVMQQKSYRDYVLSGATGSTVRHTSPSRICDYLIVMPPLEILQSFNRVVEPIIDKIEHGDRQSVGLIQIRDKLIPKLICGEIEL